jgi:hypothetical protein
MVILLLWCPVDFHGCGLFTLIGFFPVFLVGLPFATSLVSCRFPWMWTVYVDLFFSSSWLESFFFCYGGYLVSSYILFLLIFVANVVVMVLMFLFLWCLVNFVGVVCLRWLVLCHLGWNIFVMMITSVVSCSYFLKAGRSCRLVVFSFQIFGVVSLFWGFCQYSSSVVLVFMQMLSLECCPVDFVFR